MQAFIEFLAQNADHAHWWFFSLLMLAGLNLPISEDLVVLSGAVVAATVAPEKTYTIFAFIFVGCYLSDWVSYWVGRAVTPWMRRRRWLVKFVDNKQLAKVTKFYSKYGSLTLLFGRFIPFGVRNLLFMSAGMGKMHFGKFILVDGIACLLSNTIWFTIAYSLAENYQSVLSYMKHTNIVIFSLFLAFILGLIGVKLYKKIKSSSKTLP